MQGLSNVLVNVEEGIVETPAEEYAMMLEVMMADSPGRPHPPTFSCNVGMVMHIVKSNPVLRELENMQVDGPGTAYLSFMTSRAIGVWARTPRMQSGLMWRRLFQGGFCILPTLPLASCLLWRHSGKLLLPLTVKG